MPAAAVVATPLPRAGLFVICVVILSEAFSLTMLFPFVGRMVLVLRTGGVAKPYVDLSELVIDQEFFSLFCVWLTHDNACMCFFFFFF
jgi:hypothetical protein